MPGLILYKNWLHPLFIEDPIKYTQRGRIRTPTGGRFQPGSKLPHRTDPVPQKIIDILIGTLLGDCGGELSKNAVTPIFHFKQSIKHSDYIYFLYFTFVFWGYTSSKSPIPKNTLDSKGNTHKYLDFRTLSIPSLSWIYYMFYPKGIKIVPINLEKYLNRRVLAYWICDDGSWTGSGIKLHTNNFTKSDTIKLCTILNSKFGIITSPLFRG